MSVLHHMNKEDMGIIQFATMIFLMDPMETHLGHKRHCGKLISMSKDSQ